MKNYRVKRRFTIRENRAIEKKNQRLAAFLGIATLLVIIGLIFGGVPLLITFANFLGNLNRSEVGQVVQDTIPPIVPQFAAVPEATKSAAINLGGSGEPDSKVEIYLNGQLLLTTQVGQQGEFKIEKVFLQKGKNLLSALAIDESGNQSQASKELQVIYDDQPPGLEITQPQEGATVYEQSIEIKGKTESDEIKVIIGDHLVVLEKDGEFSYFYELAEGVNDINLAAEDLAGNKVEKQLRITCQP